MVEMGFLIDPGYSRASVSRTNLTRTRMSVMHEDSNSINKIKI